MLNLNIMKKLFTIFFSLCLPLLVMAQMTFYVNPNSPLADDLNDGDSPNLPWKTLNMRAWMDNSIIKLSPAVYSVDSLSYITKNVTIEGTSNSEVIFQGMSDTEFSRNYECKKFFTITNEVTVTIKNITFKNMKYVHDDGVTLSRLDGGIFTIYKNCVLNLNDVVIKNAALPKAVGGAINSLGSLNCNRVIFESCIAMQGGAVLVGEQGSATFRNTKFIKNNTLDDFSNFKYGGAICVKSPTANVVIDSCLFDSNRCDDATNASVYKPKGGAVAILVGPDNTINVDVLNSTFVNNKAYDAGAAITTSANGTSNSNTTLNLTIKNSTFLENKSTLFNIGNTINFNEAANSYKGSFTLINNTFMKNTIGNANSKSIFTNDQPMDYTIINNLFQDAPKLVSTDASGNGYSLVIQAGSTVYAKSMIAMNNIFDKWGGSVGSYKYPDFSDPLKNNKTKQFKDVVLLDSIITIPQNGVPFLKLNTNSIAIDGGVDSYLIGNTEMIPSLDIERVAIKGLHKDVGAYEYKEVNSGFENLLFDKNLLYPNPFGNFIKVNDSVKSLEIYDISGKSYMLDSNNNIVNTSILPVGFYVVKAKLANGRTIATKMSKN